MKYNNVTLGQMEAIINKLGGEAGMKEFLSGNKFLISKDDSKTALFWVDNLLNYETKGGSGRFSSPKWSKNMELPNFLDNLVYEKFSGKLIFSLLETSTNFYHHYQLFGETLLKSPIQIVREMEYLWNCNPDKERKGLSSAIENPFWYGMVWYFRNEDKIYAVDLLPTGDKNSPTWYIDCSSIDPGPGCPRQKNLVFHNNGLIL
jgi:hypothetical protein